MPGRSLLLIAGAAALVGCGDHGHKETAVDVAQRVARANGANVDLVTCQRASAKWWRCEVTLRSDGLGTSTEEIRVPVR